LEATLLNYVIEKQKTRIDLALLHLAELYAQLMGLISFFYFKLIFQGIPLWFLLNLLIN